MVAVERVGSDGSEVSWSVKLYTVLLPSGGGDDGE